MGRTLLHGLLAAIGILGLATAAVAPADAATFSFIHESGFTIGTQTHTNEEGGVEFFNPTGFSPSGGPNIGKATYHEIGWGCQGTDGPCALDGGVAATSPVANTADRSAMQIFALDGTVNSVLNPDPNTGWADITVLFHYNRSLSDRPSTLTGIGIDSLLSIVANPSNLDSPGLAHIAFTETVNAGDCTNPNPAGTQCDDFFTFSSSVFATIDFTDDGIAYQAQFRFDVPQFLTICAGGESNFANCVLSATQNGAAFDFDTPDRLYTGEDLTSEARVQLRIVERPASIPSPGAFLLLGLGLAGFAVRGRVGRT